MTTDDLFPPVAWHVVERLTHIIWACTISELEQPDVHPHPKGGVRVFWRAGPVIVEVELLNDGRITWLNGDPAELVVQDLTELDMTSIATKLLDELHHRVATESKC